MSLIFIGDEPNPTPVTSKGECPVCGGTKWNPMQFTSRGLEYMLGNPLIAVVDFTEGVPEYADECVNCGTVVV